MFELDNDPEREQACPGWLEEAIAARGQIGDAPRVLLAEEGDVEVWGLVTPWEAEELVDGMEDWPIAPGGIASA